MKPDEIVKALRCGATALGTGDCEKCAYYYRDEPSPEIAEEYGDVPDNFWESCDCDRVARDAADLIEQLLKEARNVGTTETIGRMK